MPDFLNSNKMIIIFAAVGVVLVATAVAMFLTHSEFGGDPVAESTFVANEVLPTPPSVPIEEIVPPGRWDDAFQEENIFVYPSSRLTGMPIREEYLIRRPMAVVINNIHRALPQSGIASADIIYEVLSEGDVTRIVGIFQSYIPEKIGPVRSARDYFVDFAFNHDALFIHHGASPSGYGRIRGQRINNVDGMTWEGRVFWRDRTYPYWARNTGTRPLEHSSFTGWYRLEEHIYSQGIRDYFSETPAYGFNFGEITADYVGTADRVIVPFSPNYTRTFIFNPETNLYYVENRDGAHVDALNQEQITVTNVLVQFTAQRVVDGEGRRTVQTTGEGLGYLATGGKTFPLRWVKEDHASPTRWYFSNNTGENNERDEPLTLAPGTTWINVFQSNGTVIFEIDVEETDVEETADD